MLVVRMDYAYACACALHGKKILFLRMDTTGVNMLNSGTSFKPGSPFSRDELNAILKFESETLFKEDDEVRNTLL